MRLIDADELLEHAYRDALDTREKIADMINRMPTITQNIRKNAEPERKNGELKTVGFLTCQCSECGAQFHELEYTNYCPNCGAKWSE